MPLTSTVGHHHLGHSCTSPGRPEVAEVLPTETLKTSHLKWSTRKRGSEVGKGTPPHLGFLPSSLSGGTAQAPVYSSILLQPYSRRSKLSSWFQSTHRRNNDHFRKRSRLSTHLTKNIEYDHQLLAMKTVHQFWLLWKVHMACKYTPCAKGSQTEAKRSSKPSQPQEESWVVQWMWPACTHRHQDAGTHSTDLGHLCMSHQHSSTRSVVK